MSFWDIVVPVAAQNLCVNPTPTVTDWAWSYINATESRDTTKTRRGIASIKAVPTSNVTAGIYDLQGLISGHVYYFSVDFWGATGIPYLAQFLDNSSTPVGTPVTMIGTGYWGVSRIVVGPYTAYQTANFQLFIGKNNSASIDPFWIDGMQVEDVTGRAAVDQVVTTYIDGNQPGCSWDGASDTSGTHASTSTRSGQSRAGGKIVNFDTLGWAVQQYEGVGMPPVANVILPYALQDGAFYQRTKALPRSLTLTGAMNTGTGTSLNSLQVERKALIDAVKHDLLSSDQPFWLRYISTGARRAMWLQAIYDTGLGMKYTNTDGFTETIGAGFVAVDPFCYEEGVNSLDALVSPGATLNLGAVAYRNTTSGWSNLNGGMNGSVAALAAGADGSVFIGGTFAQDESMSHTFNNVAQWSPGASQFTALNNGVNGQVFAMVVDPVGNLYAGGQMTTAGSPAVSVSRLARWDGSVWHTVGSGVNSDVKALCIGPDGYLYVGGGFTTAGSPAVSASSIGYWDGSAWHGLGAGLNDYVTAMVWGLDGCLYVGGHFTTAGSPAVTVNHVARWTPSKASWSALNGGVSADVLAMALGKDGNLYLGGSFATAGSPAATVNKLAVWNGYTWSSVGGGITGTNVSCMGVAPNGSLYVCGAFSAIGGLIMPSGYGFGVWNGSAFVYPDLAMATATPACILFDRSAGLWIGWDGYGGNTPVSVFTSFTVVSQAAVVPTLILHSPMWLVQIVNMTTGAALYFNTSLVTGEVAYLNLKTGAFGSNLRPVLSYTILPGSNLSTFKLIPGVNVIEVFAKMPASGGSGSDVRLQCVNAYHGLDGGAN